VGCDQRLGPIVRDPHLVVLSRSIPPDTGGYQRQMTLLAPYLRPRFGRSTWIGGLRERPGTAPGGIDGVDRMIRIRADHLPAGVRGAASPAVLVCGLALALWARLRRRDVHVLLLSPGMPGAPLVVRTLVRLGAAVVARYPTAGDLTERRGRSVARARGVRAIAPSPLQTRERTEFSVTMVPNAVAASTGHAPRHEVEPIGRRRRFVYVGRLIRRKRADLLIDAWGAVLRDLPEWELVLVGGGGVEPDSIEAEIRAQVDTGSMCRVVLTGNVRDPSEVLRSSDVFVFPSVKEGQPNSVLEALAEGLAVIADPIRMAEWFDPVPPLLPWSGQPEDLAQAMRHAAGRDDLGKIGAEGRAFVERHHRPQQTAQLIAAALGVA